MNTRQPDNIDALNALYPDSEWIEDKGQFSRVTTSPEESIWYCTLCGSTSVDAYDNICYFCGEEEE